MTDINKHIEKLVNMLQSPKANIRYEACEHLRVSPAITPEAIIALQNALNDPYTSVAEAAQRALAVQLSADLMSKTDKISTTENSTNNSDLGKKSPFTSCLEIFLAIFIGFIFGSLCGYTIGSKYDEGWKVPWYSLGTPPEPAQKILASTFSSIEFQSATGQHYTFQAETINFNELPLVGHWIKSETSLEEWNDPGCKVDANYVSPPPYPVKDSSFGDYCGEVNFHVIYAILEDGSVWRWSTPGGFHSLIYGFYGCIIGAIAGLIALLAIKSILLNIKIKDKKRDI